MGHGMLQDHALVPIHALDRALDHALVQELLQALGQRQVQEVLGHAPDQNQAQGQGQNPATSPIQGLDLGHILALAHAPGPNLDQGPLALIIQGRGRDQDRSLDPGTQDRVQDQVLSPNLDPDQGLGLDLALALDPSLDLDLNPDLDLSQDLDLGQDLQLVQVERPGLGHVRDRGQDRGQGRNQSLDLGALQKWKKEGLLSTVSLIQRKLSPRNLGLRRVVMLKVKVDLMGVVVLTVKSKK